MSNQTHPTSETPTEVSTPTSEEQEEQKPLTRQQKRKNNRKRAKWLAKEVRTVAISQGKQISRNERREKAFDYTKGVSR